MGGSGRCSRHPRLVGKPRCGQWQTPFFLRTPSIQWGSHDRLLFSGDGVGKSAHCLGRRCTHVYMERERGRETEDIASYLSFSDPFVMPSTCTWEKILCVLEDVWLHLLLFLTFDWAEGSRSRILAHAFQKSRHLFRQYPQMQTKLLSCMGMTLTSRRYRQTCNRKTVHFLNCFMVNIKKTTSQKAYYKEMRSLKFLN